MMPLQEHGVTVYRDIDKSKFIEAVQPMHEAFESKGDAYKSLYEDIQKYAVAEEEEK
jgi:TRAP-type C4-dicarboxylate transport system substrate-binding protein